MIMGCSFRFLKLESLPNQVENVPAARGGTKHVVSSQEGFWHALAEINIKPICMVLNEIL